MSEAPCPLGAGANDGLLEFALGITSLRACTFRTSKWCFLIRLPLNSTLPTADIVFTHSVLGTPVLDRYVWRFGPHGWLAHLIEERFEGEGYGLPTQAAAGERLERYGAGSRLLLNRVVDPLVVLPLPAQSMRIVLPDQREFLLGQLSLKSIEMRAENCPVP